MSATARQLYAVTAVALLGLPVQALLAQRAVSDTENGSLNEKLVLAEATIRGLTESLAVANGETELFKRKYDDLNDRIEALGIAPAGKEVDHLRSRLLAAVRDLRLLQSKDDSLRERLVVLSEAVMGLLKSSEGIDATSRLKVEEALRSSSRILDHDRAPVSPDRGLTSANVVAVKPDLSLAVADIGLRNGVKTGMPFQVWRGNRQIASARVVDVRDGICGAVIQSQTSETVKEGDSLHIDTTR